MTCETGCHYMLIGPPSYYVGPGDVSGAVCTVIFLPPRICVVWVQGVDAAFSYLLSHPWCVRAIPAIAYDERSDRGWTHRVLGRLAQIQLGRLRAGCTQTNCSSTP